MSKTLSAVHSQGFEVSFVEPVSEVVATKMTVHRTSPIFDRYDIVSQGDLDDVVRKLDEHMVTIRGAIEKRKDQTSMQVVEM